MTDHLIQEDLSPGDRVLAFGVLRGEVRGWILPDEPYFVWGVYVRFDGYSYLNFVHTGHLEKL